MEQTAADKLGKRLSYILRYGALKEGLQVSKSGFVKVDDLLCLNLMHHNDKAEVINQSKSFNVIGRRRFEIKDQDGCQYIRACYGRQLLPPKEHSDSHVLRLLEICLSYICQNIKWYYLEDFSDEHLLRRIYYNLKFEKRLTNSVMPNVIGRVMDSIDFDGIYITEKTLRLLGKRCPNLKSLNLRSCGYIVTDLVLQQLLKNLRRLVYLNISCCSSITDRGIRNICQYNVPLENLDISNLKLITANGLKDLTEHCHSLQQINIQGIPCVDMALVLHLIRLANIANSQRHKDLKVFSNCQ